MKKHRDPLVERREHKGEEIRQGAPSLPLSADEVAEIESDGAAVRRFFDQVIANEAYQHAGLTFSHEGDQSTDEVFDFRVALEHSQRRLGVVLTHLKQGWTAKIVEHEGATLVSVGGRTAIPPGQLPGRVRSLVTEGISRMARG